MSRKKITYFYIFLRATFGKRFEKLLFNVILGLSITFIGEKNMPLINKKDDKPKFYSDLTKGEMVKIIAEQKGILLPALERATKVDIENIAKALKVNANYKGA